MVVPFCEHVKPPFGLLGCLQVTLEEFYDLGWDDPTEFEEEAGAHEAGWLSHFRISCCLLTSLFCS